MDCLHPKTIWPHRSEEWLERYEECPVTVPCGKCLACLEKVRGEWIFRLEIEHRHSSGALFITLTYDEKHLRSDCNVNKRDVQLWLKRLRKAHGPGIRYFAVGEYGSKFGRPHYHVLLFNCTNDGMVRNAWKDVEGKPIGLVHVGRVTRASIAYCTKYIIQKDDDVGEREKPFRLMSRAYGIGGRYLSDEMVAWHRRGLFNYAMVNDTKVALPRFYRDKIWYDMDQKQELHKASLLLVLGRRIAAEKFYKDRFGENWQRVMDGERDDILSRVKSKVAYSQTL